MICSPSFILKIYRDIFVTDFEKDCIVYLRKLHNKKAYI